MMFMFWRGFSRNRHEQQPPVNIVHVHNPPQGDNAQQSIPQGENVQQTNPQVDAHQGQLSTDERGRRSSTSSGRGRSATPVQLEKQDPPPPYVHPEGQQQYLQSVAV